QLTVSSLKLIFIILQEPQRLQKCDRAQLAQLTGISIKSVSRSLKALQQLDYLQSNSNQKYTINNYLKLFERWELGYQEMLRPTLFLQAYRPLKLQNWVEQQDVINILKAENILVGGEWGADILTQYLRSNQIVFHLPNTAKIQQIMLKLRLVPDAQGNIIFLRQFGQRNHGWLHETLNQTPVVDPLLIHAELSLKPDARLKEVSQLIYDKYLLPRQKRAEMM
ncbi:MAG: type IV toxin-antitoxin system AbiEi family antitoxin, partial [Jaaginema sp. PMC 1079.18]|nr:type IV toxin-antitoxin system AbiEi family antitoxin [Jaaginema sp. PMC 1079.18]